jgi:hypothetical protein
MIAGSRLGGSAYIWTDKRGGNHIIDLGTRVVNSELSYLDDNNQRVYYSIPTIQNVSVQQNVTLPTHPTLDNSYIQQFAKENPAKINFDMILAEELFTNFDVLAEDGSVEQRDLTTDEFIELQDNEDVSIDDILDDTGMYSVKDLIGIFEDIRSNRRVFTLTTNLQMNDLLDNLVISSISYVADKESRSVVACSIEAERVHFAQIKYATLDAEEVNGLMVNSSDSALASDEIYADYTLGADGDFAFSDTGLEAFSNFLLNKESDIHVRFGDAMTEYCKKNGLSTPVPLYILTQEIDRNQTDSSNLVYSFRFPSDFGINITGETQSKDRGAAYEFYTYKIKFGFGGHKECKIKDIYWYGNARLGEDIAEVGDNISSSIIGTNRLAALNPFRDDLDTPKFHNGVLDRETGLYDLVESYNFLGVTYNTEKRLKYKDVKSALASAGAEYVSTTPSTISSGQLTIRGDGADKLLHNGYVQGYECKTLFPSIKVSAQDSGDGPYGSATELFQRGEIDWQFGKLRVQFSIKVGYESLAANRNKILDYWKREITGGSEYIDVHYGVLFVGAKVLIIMFNPSVMNSRTVVKTQSAVE